MKKTLRVLIVLLGLGLVACGSSEQDTVTVSDVWGRPSPASAANAAFYMNIHNNAQVQDSLSKAEIDICERTELHQTMIDDAGVMRMEHTERIDIPSGEIVSLEPGGYHVMCMGLQSQLQAGDQILITLSFAESGDLQVQAEIREQ